MKLLQLSVKRMICVIALMVLCVSVAAAENVTYNIPQFGLTLKIPSIFTCATKETKETEAFYQTGVYDYTTAYQTLFGGNVYLCGFTTENEVLTLNVETVDDFDFNSADNETMMFGMQTLLNQLAEQGKEVVEYSIYQGNNGRSMFIHSAEGQVHTLTYTAQHDSYSFHINFSSISEINKKSAELIKEIFESIEWEEKKQSEGIEYYHYKDAGMHFKVSYTEVNITLPSGWIYGDRNVTDNDRICEELGMTSKEIIENYLNDDCYACAVFEGMTLMVYRTTSYWISYNKMNDEVISSINKSYLNTDDGQINISSGVVRYNAPFFKCVVELPQHNDLVVYTYITTTDDEMEYEFSFFYKGKADKANEEMFDLIISNIVFGE